MAGVKKKSGPPSNQNAFRHGLAAIQQRRVNGIKPRRAGYPHGDSHGIARRQRRKANIALRKILDLRDVGKNARSFRSGFSFYLEQDHIVLCPGEGFSYTT